MYLPKTTILLLTLLSLTIAHGYGNHDTCNHDTLEFNPEVVDVNEEHFAAEGRLLQNGISTYPIMRFHAHYDTITVGTPEFKSYIQNELLPPIISLLQAAIGLKYPLSTPMKIPIKKICGIDSPRILNTTGVSTDFFMMITSQNDTTSNWIAYASNCLVSSRIKRPLVANLALNIAAIKPATLETNPLGHEFNMYVLMHEIFHALGFSKNFFWNYVDNEGNLLKNHIKKVSIDGTNRIVLDLPPLTARLRKFYGCPTLEGAFMEDDGGNGTAGSHWERKFFPFDLLSSGAIPGRRLTEFTLAYLEGTGWYAPNYTYAEPFSFGQGQGCDFVYNKCQENSSNFEEFCTGNGRECTQIGRGGGVCKSDICSDGCKFVTPQFEYDCENSDGIHYTPFASKQAFGRDAGSKCFSGNLSTSGVADKTTYCFKYNCTGTGLDTALDISFGTTKLTCLTKGPLIVEGYSGAIDCPDPIQFCSTIGKKYCPRGCMARGECVENKCVCNKGFAGVDCGFRDLSV